MQRTKVQALDLMLSNPAYQQSREAENIAKVPCRWNVLQTFGLKKAQ
jgi:hypothetical protein